MASAKPIIGITTYLTPAAWGAWEMEAALVPADYVRGVVRAGGVPFLVPPGASVDAVLGVVDGLVFTGGSDLDPELYGAEAHSATVGVIRERDDFELSLMRAALGLTPFLSEAGLSGPLDAVRAGFPDLVVRVVSDWSPHQLERIGRNELDAAAVCLPDGMMPPADLIADDLGVQPVIFVVAQDMKIPATVDLEQLSQMAWVINQDGCGFRDTLKRRFEAAHLPFNVAIDALDVELRLSLVARGVGVSLVTPVGLRRSAFRNQLKQVKVRDFKPKVRAWLVHRAPAGRLAKPIGTFRDRLDLELKTLARG